MSLSVCCSLPNNFNYNFNFKLNAWNTFLKYLRKGQMFVFAEYSF